MKKLFLLYLFLLLLINSTFGQETASGRYLSFTYENDFFTDTDEYYTQGIRWQYLHPKLEKFFLNKVLFALPGATLNYYGISFVRDGFTPTSIRHNTIFYGDRPFAGYTFAGFLHISKDDIKKKSISSELAMGMIGPASGADVAQRDIHRWLHNIQPLGWQYQIRNDFAMKYEVTYEKDLLNTCNWFDVIGFVNARAGTIYDDFSVGVLIRIGLFNSYFKDIGYGNTPTYNEAVYKKHQLYFYVKPKEEIVSYNATLEGGMINRSSVYTIPADQVERMVYEVYYGLTYNCKAFTVSYSYALLGKEFKTGDKHAWGSINLGIYF